MTQRVYVDKIQDLILDTPAGSFKFGEPVTGTVQASIQAKNDVIDGMAYYGRTHYFVHQGTIVPMWPYESDLEKKIKEARSSLELHKTQYDSLKEKVVDAQTVAGRQRNRIKELESSLADLETQKAKER